MKLLPLLPMMAVIIGLCLQQMARADTIILRDRVLYGQILAETVSAFRFRMNCSGQVIFIRKQAIVSVRHNNRCGA